MFVLSHYIGGVYDRKVEEYEKMIARKVKESSYYTENEIRNMKPSPKQKLLKRLKEVAIWTGIALFTFSFIVYIVTHVEVEVESNQTTSQEQKNATDTSK